MGGGKENSCSIVEAFRKVEAITNKPMKWSYVEENRIGDHICYYSDLRKAQTHYPGWNISRSLDAIFEEIARNWMERRHLSAKANE